MNVSVLFQARIKKSLVLIRPLSFFHVKAMYFQDECLFHGGEMERTSESFSGISWFNHIIVSAKSHSPLPLPLVHESIVTTVTGSFVVTDLD